MKSLTIEETKLLTHVSDELRKSLAERFVGTALKNDTATQICKYVESFLKNNGIPLVPVVHINGTNLDISFIGEK